MCGTSCLFQFQEAARLERSTWVVAAQSKLSRRQQQQRAAQHAAKAAWHPVSSFFLSCSITYTGGRVGAGEGQGRAGERETQSGGNMSSSILCWQHLAHNLWRHVGCLPPSPDCCSTGGSHAYLVHWSSPMPVSGTPFLQCVNKGDICSATVRPLFPATSPSLNPDQHLSGYLTSDPVCSEPWPAAWCGRHWLKALYIISFNPHNRLCYYHHL